MCSTVSSPKPKDPVKKDPVYLRNPYLDGLGINGETMGRNSLRIDMGTPASTLANTTPVPRTGFGGGGTRDGLGLGIGGLGGTGMGGFGAPGFRIN